MSDKNWDMETDLLVAGAGPAGMTVALVAALEGLDAVVCEKADQVGGTGATSAGTLWIPGNSQHRDTGFKDSAEDAAKYLDQLIGDDRSSEHRRVYLRYGPEVIDYLEEKTDVKFHLVVCILTTAIILRVLDWPVGRSSLRILTEGAGPRFRPCAPSDSRVHVDGWDDGRQG